MNVNGDRDDTLTSGVPQGEFAGGSSDSSGESGQRACGPTGAAARSEASTADRAATAPATSITGASNSQGGEVQGGGGLDWLDVSCHGSWDSEKVKGLVARLERAKLAARSDAPN